MRIGRRRTQAEGSAVVKRKHREPVPLVDRALPGPDSSLGFPGADIASRHGVGVRLQGRHGAGARRR